MQNARRRVCLRALSRSVALPQVLPIEKTLPGYSENAYTQFVRRADHEVTERGYRCCVTSYPPYKCS